MKNIVEHSFSDRKKPQGKTLPLKPDWIQWWENKHTQKGSTPRVRKPAHPLTRRRTVMTCIQLTWNCITSVAAMQNYLWLIFSGKNLNLPFRSSDRVKVLKLEFARGWDSLGLDWREQASSKQCAPWTCEIWKEVFEKLKKKKWVFRFANLVQNLIGGF